MKTVSINYWRFAGSSEEIICEIPENLKLYCCNPNTTIVSEKTGYSNNTYIGIIPYDKEIIDYYFPQPIYEYNDDTISATSKNSEPWNCHIINIKNSQIIFYFEQIYIINIPAKNLTLEPPTLNTPIYYKQYCTHVAKYTDDYKNNIILLSNMDKDSPEFIKKLQEIYHPICYYIKINSFNFNSYPILDITNVHIKSTMDQKPMHTINRTTSDIDLLYKHNYYDKLEGCSKEEFEEAFNKELKYIIN